MKYEHKNIKKIIGDTAEDMVLTFLTAQGWNVYRPVHDKGMSDLVVYHEDYGCMTYQVKTLTRQGGTHKNQQKGSLAEGLVTEGIRPRIILPLKDSQDRLYKDNFIDWMVGVDIETGEIEFYNLDTYSKCGHRINTKKLQPCEHPEAPVLEHHKNKYNRSNLVALLDAEEEKDENNKVLEEQL
jgi:hypothetical protein